MKTAKTAMIWNICRLLCIWLPSLFHVIRYVFTFTDRKSVRNDSLDQNNFNFSSNKYCFGKNRSSHRRCSVKKVFLEILQNSQENSLFFNKVSGLRPATLLKKRLWHRCFPVNFALFLRTPLVAVSASIKYERSNTLVFWPPLPLHAYRYFWANPSIHVRCVRNFFYKSSPPPPRNS